MDSEKAYEDVSAEDALKKIKSKKDLQLIDVREEDEFAFGHIEGAKNIPLSTFSEELPKQLVTDKPVLCYCRTGQRSMYASEIFKQLGFKEVGHITGGIKAINNLIEKKIPVLEHYSIQPGYY